jgi:hypothetical protein
LWCQVVGIATRWRLTDFDETFLDTPFEVGVNKAKRDTQLFSEAALRLRAIIDGIEQIKDDPFVLAAII